MQRLLVTVTLTSWVFQILRIGQGHANPKGAMYLYYNLFFNFIYSIN